MFHSDYLFRHRISFSPLHPPQPSTSAAVRRPPPSLPPATSKGALLRPKPTYFEAQRADLHAGGLPAGIRPPTRRHARVFSGSLAVHAPARECACGRVAPSPVTRLHCQDRPAPSWCSSPPAVHSEHFFSTFCPFRRRRPPLLLCLPPPLLQLFFSRFSWLQFFFSRFSWLQFFFSRILYGLGPLFSSSSSSTTVIRSLIRALFNPNVVQSPVQWIWQLKILFLRLLSLDLLLSHQKN